MPEEIDTRVEPLRPRVRCEAAVAVAAAVVVESAAGRP